MIVILDESGTHAGSRALSVAGFVIAQDSIPPLLQEWEGELKRNQIEFLHMRDFVPPHGKYSGRSPEERQRLFTALIEIIHRHALIAVGAAIELDDFMQSSYAHALAKAPDLVDSPYGWCVLQCILQTAEWANENSAAEEITFVLEDGCEGTRKVEERFRGLKADPNLQRKIRLGDMKFVSKKDYPLTQCADFLAYEMYKELDRVISKASRPARRSMLALYRTGDRIGTIDQKYLRAQLQRGASMLEAIVSYLPPVEQFKVRCFQLRLLTDAKRETVFSILPSMRKVYEMCLACGELGKSLKDIDPKLLPPDDPELMASLMEKTFWAKIKHERDV